MNQNELLVGENFSSMMRERHLHSRFIEGFDKQGESILVRMNDAIAAMKSLFPSVAEIGPNKLLSALLVKHLWSQRLIIAPMVNDSFEPNQFWRIKHGDKIVAPLLRVSPRILTEDAHLTEISDALELDVSFARPRQTDEASQF